MMINYFLFYALFGRLCICWKTKTLEKRSELTIEA